MIYRTRPVQKPILVVEDEFMIAMDYEARLLDAGYGKVAVATTVAAAKSALEAEPVACALLDFNLRGETTAELARQLKTQGIPVIFLTGKDAAGLPDDLNDIPVLSKPVVWESIETWLSDSSRESRA